MALTGGMLVGWTTETEALAEGAKVGLGPWFGEVGLGLETGPAALGPVAGADDGLRVGRGEGVAMGVAVLPGVAMVEGL